MPINPSKKTVRQIAFAVLSIALIGLWACQMRASLFPGDGDPRGAPPSRLWTGKP